MKNLPVPSPRAQSGSESEMEMGEIDVNSAHANGLDVMPSNADLVFDCIRVGWVVRTYHYSFLLKLIADLQIIV